MILNLVKKIFKKKNLFGFVKKINFRKFNRELYLKSKKIDVSIIFDGNIKDITNQIISELENLEIENIKLLKQIDIDREEDYWGTTVDLIYGYGLEIKIGKYKVFCYLYPNYKVGDLQNFSKDKECLSLVLGEKIYYVDFSISHIEFKDYFIDMYGGMDIYKILENKILNYFNSYAEMKSKEFIYDMELLIYKERNKVMNKLGYNIDDKIKEEFKPLKKDFVRLQNIKEQIEKLNNEINLIRKKYD